MERCRWYRDRRAPVQQRKPTLKVECIIVGIDRLAVALVLCHGAEEADGDKGGVESHWLLGWAGQRPDSYKGESICICLPIRVKGRLTASRLKVVTSKSFTANSALRVNFHSNIPQILEHSLAIRVHRHVDPRFSPITPATGTSGGVQTSSATCTAHAQGSQLGAYPIHE